MGYLFKNVPEVTIEFKTETFEKPHTPFILKDLSIFSKNP